MNYEAIFKIILLHFSYLGIGLWFLDLTFKNITYKNPIRFPLAYFLGVFINILILHAGILLKFTSPMLSWFLLIIGMLGFFYHLYQESHLENIIVKIEASKRKSLLISAFILLLILPVIYLTTLKLTSVPDISYDSLAFWNLKAKFFFYGEHLWTEAFLDPNRVSPHQNYPLYRSLFLFEHFSILGAADDFLCKPGFWIYYWTGVVLFFLLLQEWVSLSVALMLIGIFLYTPLYSFKAVQGAITTTYVDFPLSIMILGSVGSLLRYFVHGNKIDIFCSMTFVGSAIMMKREGSIWFILFTIFTFLALYLYHQKKWHNDYLWLGIPLFIYFSWKIIVAELPYSSELHPLTSSELVQLISSFPKTIIVLAKTLLNRDMWGVFGLFVTLIFIVGLLKNIKKDSIYALLPACMVIGYLGCIILLIMMLDVQTDRFTHFTEKPYSLIHRLIIHIAPSALFLATVLNSSKFHKRVWFKQQRPY